MTTVKTSLKYLIISCLIIFSIALAEPNPTDIDRSERHRCRIVVPFTDGVPHFQPTQISAKKSDFADLRISETVSPATFAQKNSSVVSLDGGEFVVVWQDNRSGSYKILAQLFDSTGSPISSNSLLAGRDDGYNLIEPKAVSDGFGGFYLAWRDESSGKIFAARHDVSLSETIAPFVINDISSISYAGPYDIDSYSDQRLITVWEDYGTANNICLRIFSSTGTPLTDAIKINSDTNFVSHWVPSLAVDGLGAMGIVWEDYRNGNADIYFQLVNADGSLRGPNLGIVEGLYDDSVQYLPEIVYSARDGYAISWLDRRHVTQRVYTQRYATDSGLVGGNIEISNSDSLANDWDIAMDVSSSGDLSLAWASIGETEQILLQRFSSGFTPNGTAVIVSSHAPGSRWGTSLCVGVSDKLICSWTDFRSGNDDIYLELLSSAGTPLLVEDLLVNDDSAGAESTEPDLAIIDQTKGVVVFTDARNDAGDIFMQLAGADGSLIGTNLKVSSDLTGSLQNEPAVAVSSSDILVVWNDSRPISGTTGQRIFGRYLSHSGDFNGPDFVISDSDDISSKNDPRVAMTIDGNAITAWVDYRYGTGHVFGRHLNPDGSASAGVFPISSLATDLDNDCVSIDIDDNSNFSIVWLSRGFEGGPTAIAARYSSTGEFINRFSFTSDVSGVEIRNIATATKGSGATYLLWEGIDTEKHLYLTALANDGTVITPTFEVTDSFSDYASDPDIFIDDEGFIVTSWVDSRSGRRQVYTQIFDPNLSTVGPNSLISHGDPEFTASPVVAAINQKGWFAWSDPRDEGLNVYLSQVSYSSVDVEDNEPDLLPSQYILKQNYPNPFNPSTIIEFTIPTRGRVNITVYNILGEKVSTLTDGVYESGHYTIDWDGSDNGGISMPSGIYFYKMTVEGKQLSRKMLLIK